MNNKAGLSLIIAIGLLLAGVNSYSQDTTKKTVVPVKKVYTKPISLIKPAVQVPAQQAPATTQPLPSLPPAAVDNSLAGQYTDLERHTYGYHLTALQAYHKNVMDTLNAAKHKLRDAQKQLSLKADTIAKLGAGADNKDQTIAEAKGKTAEISFIGVPMTKTLYNLIMWGLVVVLGAALATVIYLSGSNKNEAAYRIQLYDELTEEFKAYKAKANEKEKKLARELQTERNKLDELMGKK